jgi:hypothetical protein
MVVASSNSVLMNVLILTWIEVYPSLLLEIPNPRSSVTSLSLDLMNSINSGDDTFHSDIWNKYPYSLALCCLTLRYFLLEIMETPVTRMPFIEERVISLLW